MTKQKKIAELSMDILKKSNIDFMNQQASANIFTLLNKMSDSQIDTMYGEYTQKKVEELTQKKEDLVQQANIIEEQLNNLIK